MKHRFVVHSAPYTVREIPDLSPDEWDDLVRSSPGGGHIFQSFAWGEFKRHLGWKPVRVAIERDGEVVGVGQFLSYNTLPIPGCLMFCPKGPWLSWNDEGAVRTFFEGVSALAAAKGAHTLKIEPEVREEWTDAKSLLRELGFKKFRWDLNFKTTMVVDLRPSEEELLTNMNSRARYNVRLAGRKGVEVVEDSSSKGLEHFWHMFEVTADRNGFWYRPREYQIPMWQALVDAGQAHLFFAMHERDRLAGVFVGNLGHKCWYQYGASTNHKRNLKSTHLLQWEVMEWAKRHNITYYDMVSIPSPSELHNENHPLYGVYKFKASLGGQVADFVGCLDLPVKPIRAKLWNKVEPAYYRFYRRLHGDIYY